MKQVLTKVLTPQNIEKIEKIASLLKENRKVVLALLAVSIFVDIFLVKLSSDFVIFGVLLAYGIFIKMFQIKNKLTFLLCLGLLGAMFINYLFTGPSIPTEKAAVWLVLFMALGIFQQWRE